MEIKKLRLKNFRNYMDGEVNFSKRINLIFGENAQGKTNIIEALYMLSTGKSHRTNNINEMVKYGEDFFSILLEFEENEYEQTIEIRYEKGKGKALYINEVKKEKMSDLLGIIPAVLFAPESLMVVKGSPGERRKAMDIVLCQTNRKYLLNLQKYNRIIRNKNILLKKIKMKKEKEEYIDVWNEAQAITGSELSYERNLLIKRLEEKMNKIQEGISQGKEQINIKYKTYWEGDINGHKKLLLLIKENIKKEIDQGSCLLGPHRDDMEIYVNGKNSRLYCSQGQQRSVALALNIGIMEEIKAKMGKNPVLLLDDVMSELDEKRKLYLYDFLENNQTMITATEQNEMNHMNKDNIKNIRIHQGKIYEE